MGFGIRCAKLILDGIKTLIGEWWAKIRFRDFESFDKRVDAISKGLTVMGTVQEAVAKNVIDQETGNLLRTRVLREVDNLIGIGATLPLEDKAERIDQRSLLVEQRNRKLLGSGEAGAPVADPSARWIASAGAACFPSSGSVRLLLSLLTNSLLNGISPWQRSPSHSATNRKPGERGPERGFRFETRCVRPDPVGTRSPRSDEAPIAI